MTARTARDVLEEAMSEDALLARVTDALTMPAYRWTHSRRSDRAQLMGHRGFPDVVAIRGTRILAIELKTERGRLEDDQSVWLEVFAGAGVDARVLRPRDLVAFERELGLL